ncbi:hypothetical protein [Flectobacillus major]|uniref:hypothetical protein n=1 Tax=Flectobacillus major TaxID=103 RepID=UPI000415CADA|nr:hypothetical protein [Flectobacillus major]
MPIPQNITQEHIFQAMLRIRNEGIQPKDKAKKYVVEYEDFQYPVKLVIAYANIFANGDELDRNPNNFQSHMSIKFLEGFGFKIVDVKKTQIT